MSEATRPYNTALALSDLSALRERLGETDHAASQRGVVFAHTVGAPYLPGQLALIESVECIYSALPYPAGWSVFHKRAGITPLGSHAEYIAAVKSTIIDRFEKPSFLLCDKRSAARLSERPPRPIRLEYLKGQPQIWLATINVAEPPIADDTAALSKELSQRYRSVYDFGCGYGAPLRTFEYFIGSDIDQKCLDYIARELL